MTASKRAATERPPEAPDEAAEPRAVPESLADIGDLIGSVDDALPEDLSARKKHYLRVWGYGRNRSAQNRQQR
ncbi:MAG: hypothetical protein WAN86_22605 [Hyphomicrobiaceae bacterium]